jgi:RNA polymerase sigma-70 factor (ECF subfamily)
MTFALWFQEPPDTTDDGRELSSGWAKPRQPRARDTIESAAAFDRLRDDDQRLIVEIIDGNSEALATLFRRHAPSLDRVALGVLRSRDLVHDAVQSVFVRVWERRTALVPPADVAAYLHRAVYNAARDLLRAERREFQRRDVGRLLAHDPARQVNSSPAEPDVPILDAELARQVQDAIAALPGRSGEIFRLWWSGTMTYAEIASATGMSVKGVEQARARAITRLREALRGYWP